MGSVCMTAACISVVLGVAKFLLVVPLKPGKDE